MLLRGTPLWECKANEETTLSLHSNESIETDVYLILMIRW